MVFHIDYELENYLGRVHWMLVEKLPMQLRSRTLIKKAHVKHTKNSANQRINFDFHSSPNKVYAVIGRFTPKSLKKNNVKIKALNVSVQFNKNNT